MSKYFGTFFLVIAFLYSQGRETTEQVRSGKASLLFRENIGQIRDQYGNARDDIRFQVEANGASIFIGKGHIHYQWNSTDSSGAAPYRPQTAGSDSIRSLPVKTYRMDMVLLGSNPQAVLDRGEPTGAVDIYYAFGLAGQKARSYQQFTYKNIYPDIDWVFYTKDGVLKYDFVVHPGGKVSDIKMQYGGTTGLLLQEGQLLAQTPMGTVTEAKPYSYDPALGQEVTARYVIDKDIVRFEVGSYEGTLVIDPELRLDWGTYYGGTGVESAQYNLESNQGYWAYGISTATEPNGNVYLYGTTTSVNNIATTGAYQATLTDGNNVYLAKFNARGERLWSTYFGGNGGSKDEEGHYVGTVSGRGHAVVCDTAGNVYITGNTRNTSGIATAGAHQPNLNGNNGWPDLFLARFDSSGNRIWATYLGNPMQEEGGSLAVTPDGSRIFIAGATKAHASGVDAIATTNGFFPAAPGFAAAPYSGFINCFNALGQRQWGTYISDVTLTSTIYDLVPDKQGAVYITGYGKGNVAPGGNALTTTGSHQPNFTSCNPNPGGYGIFWETPDAFLQKWDINGNRLWGTYYGDGGIDIGYSLATDDNANVYLSGINSTSYPHDCNWFGPWMIATPGSYMDTKPDATSSFLVKFSGSGQRQWGTFYHGYYLFGNSTGLAVYKDLVFCLFHTARENLATPCAFQTSNPSIYPTESSLTAHLAIFDTTGSRKYATYFGGKLGAWAGALSVSETAGGVGIYMAGLTSSPTNIATPASFQPTLSPGIKSQDAFLARFTLPLPQALVSPCFTADSVALVAADTTGIDYYWSNGKIGNKIWASTSGTYVVHYLKSGCPMTDTLLVSIYPLPALQVTQGCKNEGLVQLSVANANKNVYAYKLYTEAGDLMGTTQSDRGTTFSGLNTGTYRLQIVGGTCDTTLHFLVEAYPDPVVNISDDTLIVAGQSAQLQATGALTYRWLPNRWLDNAFSATPVSTPLQDITYTVTGYNDYGCRAIADVRITVREHIFIPNAFSPNGDGINDEFKIGAYGFHKLASFSVFNRYGEEVFHTTNPALGWDGSYKNKPADLGTYYFRIQLHDNQGEEKTFKGDLTLVR